MSYVDISVAQMQDFMDALGFRELSVEEHLVTSCATLSC